MKSLPSTDGLVFKLGLGNIPYFSEKNIRSLVEKDISLFIDLKLHDIPSQVERAVKLWSGWGVRFVTVHLGGGVSMLEAAASGASSARQNSLTVLGVSVLTSLDARQLRRLGWKDSVREQVLRWVKIGMKSGLSSFVCSASDLGYLKKGLGEKNFRSLRWVTPGVICEGDKAPKDQARVVRVAQALKSGSSLLVMGRSLLGARDPVQRIQKVQAEIRTYDYV